jgi:hypothetical protein
MNEMHTQIATSGIPPQYDHTNIVFESPKADIQLGLLQAKLADPRRDPSAIDLFDLIRCEREDVQDQKGFVTNATLSFRFIEKHLKDVAEIVLKAAAGQYDQITRRDKETLQAYLVRQENRWEQKERTPMISEVDHKTALANKDLFKTLRESLFANQAEEELYHEESFNQSENPPTYQYPSASFTPDKSKDAAEAVGHEANFKRFLEFIEAIGQDFKTAQDQKKQPSTAEEDALTKRQAHAIEAAILVARKLANDQTITSEECFALAHVFGLYETSMDDDRRYKEQMIAFDKLTLAIEKKIVDEED